MQKPLNLEFFEGYAQEIISKNNRIAKLIPPGNANLASGDYNEEVLRSVIRNFLPARYSVKRGYVYVDEQSISKQVDILIIDENEPFGYLLQVGDFAIVSPQAVVAVIEVKTDLTKKEFVVSFENICSVKKVIEKYYGYNKPVKGIMFSYDSKTKLTDYGLIDWFADVRLKEVGELDEALWPDLIYNVKRERLLVLDCGENKINDKYEMYYFTQNKEDKTKNMAWQFSILLAEIIAGCEMSNNVQNRTLKNPEVGRTLDFDKVPKTFFAYRPGQGIFNLDPDIGG